MKTALEERDKLFKNLGMFIVRFEQICHYMRLCIIWAFHRFGLNNQELIRTMLADLTAEPLRMQLLVISNQIYGENSSHYRVIKELMNEIKSVIEKRNNIIHGLWLIPADSEYEKKDIDVVAQFIKEKKSGKGLSFSDEILTLEEFEKLNSELFAIIKKLSGLSVCMTGRVDKTDNIDLTIYNE